MLTAPANGSKSTSSSTTSSARNSKVAPTYGLGLTGTLDISTKTGADLARSQLLGVLSNIQSTYQTTNTPPPTTPRSGNTSGTASAATTGAAGQLQSGAVAAGHRSQQRRRQHPVDRRQWRLSGSSSLTACSRSSAVSHIHRQARLAEARPVQAKRLAGEVSQLPAWQTDGGRIKPPC